ncbi:unnamed protein product [Lactuca saligna]|uniref:3-oxo-5-alpha-steroid 4-dehydrogenase C-terminal domain-containing protein n=1 Tax=Lactuca saligna TaxID=75948 RepID=A0AA35YKG5_LACSI|nr:unnamed protein product [Lactuca saligna]
MEEVGMSLVSLLRAAWILITLPIVVGLVPFPGLAWLHTILTLSNRGKILQSNSKLTVPQRFFSHFYAMAILWTTLLLVAMWSYATTSHVAGGESHANISVFLLVLMELHLLRRFYETIYVFKYSPSARMHISGYLLSLLYYALAPLSLCCNFVPQVFDSVNGRVGMSRPGSDKIWMFVTPFSRLPWYAWIGAVIFLWGWVHQLCCHRILGSLRDKTKNPEEYVIPYGDWFEYVSSPHYTAEIVANLVYTAKETQGCDLCIEGSLCKAVRLDHYFVKGKLSL